MLPFLLLDVQNHGLARKPSSLGGKVSGIKSSIGYTPPDVAGSSTLAWKPMRRCSMQDFVVWDV